MQQAALLAGAKLERSSDKGLEQRVSAVGTALELRMELCAQMEVRPGSSTVSTRRPSGLVPEMTRPASCIS